MAKSYEYFYEITMSLDGCSSDHEAESAYEILQGMLEESSSTLKELGITSVTMELNEKRRVM